MKFKLISRDGDFLPMLYRAQEEGHDVICYIEKTSSSKCYAGIIRKAETVLELDLGPRDVILFDMVGGGKGADVLIKKGYYVIGASALNDEIELDRAKGSKFMTDHSIMTPPAQIFNDFGEAKKFIEKNPDRYVFKPHGNIETDLTYVSSGPENMLGILPHLEKDCKKESGDEEVEFELQTFVVGTEMSTEAWFNGKRFIMPINSTMEEKKFMVGNCGPNTGCMGNVVWTWDEKRSEQLYNLFFKELEPSFESAGYVGPLDINCIWTPEGPYGLEWSARFGYDAIHTFSRLIDMPFGEFLIQLRGMKSIPVKKGIALGVRVSIPPFPNKGDVPRVPIMGITPQNKNNVYLTDAMLQDGELVCAGTGGHVMCVCSNGPSMSFVNREIHTIIEGIQLADKQYRIDIGERYQKDRQIVEKILDSLL